MLRLSLGLALLCLGLAGCATPPQDRQVLSAFASIDTMTTQSIGPRATQAVFSQPMPALPGGPLAGRTLTVSDTGQIALARGEVILTFDDGPRPGVTEPILASLDQFGVKATFLMLGSAAERHPSIARLVAEYGHTIGTHTYDHVDLSKLPVREAVAEIYAGHQAVASALAPINREPSRFFRFPYLAQTGLIRTSAVDSSFIVLDVDVDSKDYYTDTAQAVLARTLDRLDARGSGVILFHDIHARTASMLPEFLTELHRRGYKVVSLRATGGGVFDHPVITANLGATGEGS